MNHDKPTRHSRRSRSARVAAIGACVLAAAAVLAGCAQMSQSKQLNEYSFGDIKPGMSSDQVLAQLGRPSNVFGAGYQDRYHVWNYRWSGADCVWFQISINDSDQRVKDASMSPDPKCDSNSRD